MRVEKKVFAAIELIENFVTTSYKFYEQYGTINEISIMVTLTLFDLT